jgi:hypothetical protein
MWASGSAIPATRPRGETSGPVYFFLLTPSSKRCEPLALSSSFGSSCVLALKSAGTKNFEWLDFEARLLAAEAKSKENAVAVAVDINAHLSVPGTEENDSDSSVSHQSLLTRKRLSSDGKEKEEKKKRRFLDSSS